MPSGCRPVPVAYKTASENLAQRGRRPRPGQDLLTGTSESSLTEAQSEACAGDLLGRNTAAGDRDLSMGSFMTGCVARSHDARLVGLADFVVLPATTARKYWWVLDDSLLHVFVSIAAWISCCAAGLWHISMPASVEP
jgi:hypothetical protein